MLLQVTETNGKIAVTDDSGKIVREFDNVNDAGHYADEQNAGEACRTAGTHFLAAVTGGKEYRRWAFAAGILRHVVDDKVTDDKVKARDLTDDNVRLYVSTVTRDELIRAVDYAIMLADDVKTASGKYQSPLPGGVKPISMVKAFCRWLRPASATAVRHSAANDIAAAMGVERD
jgi:hypothetical protein